MQTATALRRLIATGSDLSKSMVIDFAVAVPDRSSGLRFAAVAQQYGFAVAVEQDESTQDWTCYCSRTMVPSYAAIIAAQVALAEVGRPFDATPDGWGSFGNADDAPPK